jgi:hypothetical protein
MASKKSRPGAGHAEPRDACITDDGYGVPNTWASPPKQAGRGKATAEDRATAKAIAGFVAKRRAEGASSARTLIEIDRHRPGIPFTVVLAAHFFDQLAAFGELPQ